jgi:predicted enzyme related to lactoylglutathione lyase
MSTASTATATTIKGIDVHAYLVKDPARAIAFYRDALGLPVSTQMEQGAEFELADGSTFGVWHMQDGSWHPSAGVMFAVHDLAQAAPIYRERGVKFLDGPFDTGSCHMAVCEDTEGNSFILHQRKA